MKQDFFNRLLHLLHERPQQGKRMVGLSPEALWELWQRIAELTQEEDLKRAQRPGRQRQVGGGRKREANVLCRLLVTLIYQAMGDRLSTALICQEMFEKMPK